MQPSPPSISRSFHHPHHKFCTQEALTPHPLCLPLQPVVISVLLPSLWIRQQHVLANTLGGQREQGCIQIWELLYQIISRVPLGGGGFCRSVIATIWARLPCPWDFPGKNTGVGSHSLLQGIFPTQGLNSFSCIGRWVTNWASREARVFLKLYLIGKGPHRVSCSRVRPHVHPQACMFCQSRLTLVVVLPAHTHWAKLIRSLLLWDCFFLPSTCFWSWGAASPYLPPPSLPPSVVSMQFSL